MKYSKIMKRILAYICTIAMVITSISGYQVKVSAEEDYSTLTYETLHCNGASDLGYCVVSSDIYGWSEPWYGDGGSTILFVYSAENDLEDTIIKVNDVEASVGGVLYEIGRGIVKLNPMLMDTGYTKVEITTTTGSAIVIIKKEQEIIDSETTDSNEEADVTTEVNSVINGDSQILDAIQASKYTIDGIEYNNYAKYTGLTASATSEKQEVARAIDGNMNTRWESEHGVDPQDLIVDFGNVYALKDIMIYWETASAKVYTIEVSEDGYDFHTITEIARNVVGTYYGEKRTDDIKLSKEINVRAVKIHGIERTMSYGYSIFEIGFYGSEEQKKITPVLSDFQIKDYYKYTGKYMLYFEEAEESEGYNVYIDDATEPLKTINGSGGYVSAEDLEGVAAGTHTLYLANIFEGKETKKIGSKFVITGEAGTFTEIPQLYIYTAKNITSEYHDDADVTVSVVDKDGGTYKDFSDGACNIKIRGNTTSAHPKKPWNIKLSGKQSILGMDKGKKWCLLANAFDKSLMRNSLAYDMGLENGVTYTCQSRFIDVYINGTYNGSYLMTEPVEAKKERVDIDAYNAKNNDILLELGTRNEPDVDHFTTDILRTTYDVNDPEKGDDLTDEEVDAKIARVKEYLNGFETTLKSHDYAKILEYIDEDTFVNFYVVSELFKNVDFNFSSTRFYIKDNRIYAGPPWDYDLSSGNCKSSFYTDYYRDGVSWKDYYCQKQNWYRELFNTEEFKASVKKRFTELQYVIQNIYKDDSTETLSINHLVNEYGKSFERNYKIKDELGAGWILTDDNYGLSSEAGWTSWEQPIDHLRDWMKNRNAWICEDLGIDMQQAYIDSNPNEQETTTEPPTEPEEITTEEITTEEVTPSPIKPIGLIATSATDNELTIKWSQTQEMIAIGQTYNVLVDNVLVMSNVVCGTYTIDAEPGEHTVSVVAVLGDKVSEAATATVTVGGEEETTLPELKLGEPEFNIELGQPFKYVNLRWEAYPGAYSYTTYYQYEGNVAIAYHRNYPFVNLTQTSVDHVACTTDGTPNKLIVYALNAAGNRIARGEIEFVAPELTPYEKAYADVTAENNAKIAAREAKFNSAENFAKYKTVNVAVAEEPDYFSKPTNMVDGDINSSWQIREAGYASTLEEKLAKSVIEIDLGEVKNVGSIMIAWEDAYANKYDIYVAGEDHAYNNIAIATGTIAENVEHNPIKSHDLEQNVDARYVKIVPTELSSWAKYYGMRIFEIGAFADATLLVLTPLPKPEDYTTEAPTTEEQTEAPTEEVTTEEELPTTEETETTSEVTTTEEVTTAEETSAGEETTEEPVAELEIVLQPYDMVTHTAGKAEFSIEATGNGLKYSWEMSKDGGLTWAPSTVDGHNTAKITFTATEGYHGRQYRCIVTDRTGKSLVSDAAMLLIKELENKLLITSHPEAVTVMSGSRAGMSVRAMGLGLKYNWEMSKDGGLTWTQSTVDGHNTSKITFTATESYHGRQYRCVVTDAGGNVLESNAGIVILKDLEDELLITAHPKSMTATAGKQSTMIVGAMGSGLKYRWEMSKDGGLTWTQSTVDGYNTSKITFTVNEAYHGRQYRCVITDENGNSTASNAGIVILKELENELLITSHPKAVTVPSGQQSSMTVGAMGQGLKYSWEMSKDGGQTWTQSTVDGYNTSKITFTVNEAYHGRQYRCVVTDKTGNSITSEAGVVALKELEEELLITSHPKRVAVSLGTNAQMSVGAMGQNLKYSWEMSKNGGQTWTASTVDGYNTSKITFTVNEAYHGRLYRCVVTDAAGNSIITKPASIVADEYAEELKIIMQPEDLTAKAGSTYRIATEVTGAGLQYKWEMSKDRGLTWSASTVDGYNTAEIGFTATKDYDGRLYRCVITDKDGKTVVTRRVLVTIAIE